MANADNAPKVSVRLPSYNHEKYVEECISSVLNQTFQDFEIIVTDDASTDRTAEIIEGFHDPRIKLEVSPKNHGCSYTVSECMKRAKGKYIANLCSDDAWEREKLQKQVDYLDEHPECDAVFTKVQLIDDDGNFIFPTGSFYGSVFEVENRTKEQWLNHFFHFGNCLCIPSVMIRKEVYDSLCYQDKRMANLSDFDLWVRFCLHHELHIMEERLTRFRLRANEANASGNRIENHIRCQFENKQILEHYLEINDTEALIRIFPECAKYGPLRSELIPYILGRLACDSRGGPKQLWGLETIFCFLEKEENAKLLVDTVGFSYVDFYALSGSLDPYDLRQKQELNSQIQELTQSREKMDQQIQQLNLEREKLIGSHSWKLTKPLRIAGNFARRIIKK